MLESTFSYSVAPAASTWMPPVIHDWAAFCLWFEVSSLWEGLALIVAGGSDTGLDLLHGRELIKQQSLVLGALRKGCR